MEETLINNKYKLILPLHRAARPEWKTGWEVERIESMLARLKEGDLVLDIGAEEGDISALLAQRTGNIILMEPNKKVWPNIRAIWEANKLLMPKMCFIGFASNEDNYQIADFTGSVWPEWAYGDIIGDHGFKELSDPGNISQIKIDTIAEKLPQNIKLMTIDVEGSEFEVLKGAYETLRRTQPLVYVSVHPQFMADHFQQKYPDLKQFMVDLGYEERYLAYDHEMHILFWPK